jgi:hypothetical protein
VVLEELVGLFFGFREGLDECFVVLVAVFAVCDPLEGAFEGVERALDAMEKSGGVGGGF